MLTTDFTVYLFEEIKLPFKKYFIFIFPLLMSENSAFDSV